MCKFIYFHFFPFFPDIFSIASLPYPNVTYTQKFQSKLQELLQGQYKLVPFKTPDYLSSFLFLSFEILLQASKKTNW